MQPLLDAVLLASPALTLAGSFVALILGVRKLTKASRLRALATTLQGAIAEAQGEYQKATLGKMHLQIVSEIVALEAVPARLFVRPWTVIGATMVIVAYWPLASNQNGNFWLWAGPILALAAPAGAPSAAALAIIAMRTRERRRVARDFRHGTSTKLEVLANTTWPDWIRGFVIATSAVMLVRSVATLVPLIPMAVAKTLSPDPAPATSDDFTNAFLLASFSGLAAWVAANELRADTVGYSAARMFRGRPDR